MFIELFVSLALSLGLGAEAEVEEPESTVIVDSSVEAEAVLGASVGL